MRVKVMLFGIFALMFMVSSAMAVPTQITVRVKTKDAKFLGTSMGGALVRIVDADTGELLARGTTTGSTGSTRLIMKTAHTRGMVISTQKSGKFTATIDIDEPRLVEVSAYGPLAQRQAANRVSATQWVVPGKHITNGDAWMLELPGLVVDVLEPPTHIKYKGLDQDIKVSANVTMM